MTEGLNVLGRRSGRPKKTVVVSSVIPRRAGKRRTEHRQRHESEHRRMMAWMQKRPFVDIQRRLDKVSCCVFFFDGEFYAMLEDFGLISFSV